MRKPGFLIPCLFALAVLTGCNKDTADKYVGEQITSMKEKGSDSFAALLEEGIAQSNEAYTLQFPEELREPYQEFLKDSFNTVTFEVSSAHIPLSMSNVLRKVPTENISTLWTTLT